MFRKLAIAVIGIFIATAAFADDDWEHRHHHRHHHHHPHHRHQGYDPFYRPYIPAPLAGYYLAPNQYYQPRPMPYFNQYHYYQPRRCEDREDW